MTISVGFETNGVRHGLDDACQGQEMIIGMVRHALAVLTKAIADGVEALDEIPELLMGLDVYPAAILGDLSGAASLFDTWRDASGKEREFVVFVPSRRGRQYTVVTANQNVTSEMLLLVARVSERGGWTISHALVGKRGQRDSTDAG